MLRLKIILLFLIIFLLSGCVITPRNAPRSPVLIPISKEMALGASAYREIIQKEKISQDLQLTQIVKRVGSQIAAVSPHPNLDWEFTLVDSERQNIFALPGGKVVIFSGILPVCANEAGLAAVMSHQIAHAIARHGAERLGPSPLAGDNPETPSIRLTAEDKPRILTAMGIGNPTNSGLVYHPDHESAADDMGLHLMARAGYDPVEAERLWSRFSKMQMSRKAPEILSTHPVDPARVNGIRQRMRKALQIYKANPLKHGLGQSFLYLLSRRPG